MSENENRGPWYLITALIIGVSMGLLYSWKLAPVQYMDTAPASLRGDYKDQYRALIASAYASNGDLARAQSRLNLLGEGDQARNLTIQAQQALADGRPQSEAHALGLLALAISQGISPTLAPPPSTVTPTPSPSLTPSPTPELLETSVLSETDSAPVPPVPGPSATATVRPTSTILARTPTPTITPLPSRTPTPTAGAPFVLKGGATMVCNPALSEPLIIVEARDAAGNPVPGVQVIVHWQGSEDRFYTGLKPELGLGYGDFTMIPGIEYTVQAAGGGQPVGGLTPNECETADKERYWGSWRVIFVQP